MSIKVTFKLNGIMNKNIFVLQKKSCFRVVLALCDNWAFQNLVLLAIGIAFSYNKFGTQCTIQYVK